MLDWPAASLLYFAYIGGLSLLLPRVAAAARLRALALAAGGATVAYAGSAAQAFWLRGLVLAPLVLLMGYWSSGVLWTGPMPRAERLLASADQALRIPTLAARLPRALFELLELAYAGVYPLIPITLGIHLAYGASPDADLFWTVILVTDFICFGMLPWVQTRPPRALEAVHPWRSPLRTFNFGLLGRISTGVNTVPSGHAAEAFAAALLVADVPLAISIWIWLSAAAVSAGAVFGRYHYALDALTGWVVALVVWGSLAR
jgi:hypothetical protein